jgi:hypothetical protein
MRPKEVAAVALVGLTIASAILVARSFESLHREKSYGPRDYLLNERLIACGKTIKCASLLGGSPSIEGNAHVVLTSCDEKPAEEMRFRGSWGRADASAPVFAWSARVHEDEVFPLHGVLAGFIHCDDSKEDNGGRPGPLVELELEPAGFAWLAPAPDHVFVPFDGEATLDHDGPATAALDAIPDAAPTPPVTMRVARAGEPPRVYEHLHVGSRFPWAEHPATIVRIVVPRPPIAGWVEVALPDPADSGIELR